MTPLIEFVRVYFAYGERTVIRDIDAAVCENECIAVIGPNGAGKTTMFRMIIGIEKPDEGTIKIGETVKLGYVDQDRSLDPNKSVYEIISEGHETIMLGKAEVNARAYCARFNFAGTDQQKKVKDISGGERNRVHLARMLKEGANLVILDEPTNDLDINTLRALEEGLESFAGCAVISSHDRWFLDRIATHIMAFEGDSKVVWFEGNYSEYEADRKKRLGKEADQPHRIRYRKLTR
jgi:sulfate-transporting ATPase